MAGEGYLSEGHHPEAHLASVEYLKPLGWLQGAGLQLVNPKAWMMALSSIAIFSLPDTNGLGHISWLAIIFFIVAVPCQLCWSWLGQSASLLSRFPSWETRINRLLVLSLLGVVWGAVWVL